MESASNTRNPFTSRPRPFARSAAAAREGHRAHRLPPEGGGWYKDLYSSHKKGETVSSKSAEEAKSDSKPTSRRPRPRPRRRRRRSRAGATSERDLDRRQGGRGARPRQGGGGGCRAPRARCRPRARRRPRRRQPRVADLRPLQGQGGARGGRRGLRPQALRRHLAGRAPRARAAAQPGPGRRRHPRPAPAAAADRLACRLRSDLPRQGRGWLPPGKRGPPHRGHATLRALHAERLHGAPRGGGRDARGRARWWSAARTSSASPCCSSSPPPTRR